MEDNKMAKLTAPLNGILSFLQAQSGNLTDNLDNLNLLGTNLWKAVFSYLGYSGNGFLAVLTAMHIISEFLKFFYTFMPRTPDVQSPPEFPPRKYHKKTALFPEAGIIMHSCIPPRRKPLLTSLLLLTTVDL